MPAPERHFESRWKVKRESPECQRTWFRHQLVAERIDAESEDVEAIGARVLAAFTHRGGNG